MTVPDRPAMVALLPRARIARAARLLPVGTAAAVALTQSAHRPPMFAVLALAGLALGAAAGDRAPSRRRAHRGAGVRAAAPTVGVHGSPRNAGRVAGALVVLAVAAAYFATLSPTTNATDSIEFQLVSATLRIAHAPGYALYTLLGHAMTRLPVADVAWRMNALSAYAGIVAATLAFALARRLASDALAGVAAALAVAFTPQLWSQAVITEVYTLNVAIVLAILTCLAHMSRRRNRDARPRAGDAPTQPRPDVGRDGWRLAALVLCGLGFTHHLTTVFLYPAVAWLVLAADPTLFARPRDVGRCALALLVGLTPLLYFPWRWQSVNGVAPDVRTVLSFVTARNYPGLFDLGRLPEEPARWYLLAHEVGAALAWPALVLAVIGIAGLVARRRSAWSIALVAVVATYAVFYLGYFAWDGWVVLLPALACMAVGAGVGAATAATVLSRATAAAVARGLVAMVCAATVLTGVVRTWPRVDASRGWSGQAAADAALAERIPEGARLVVDPSVGAGFLYARHLKGVRRDLDVVYADWPDGRRALADPVASDRPVVVYGMDDGALRIAGTRVVPLGALRQLVPQDAAVSPPAMRRTAEVVGTPDGAVQLTGWRAIPSPARPGAARLLPGDELAVQLAWRVRPADGHGAIVRLRIVSDDSPTPLAAADAPLDEPTGRADGFAEARLALARETAPGAYRLEGVVSRPDATIVQPANRDAVQPADAADADAGDLDDAWRTLGSLTIDPIRRSDLARDPAFVDVMPVRQLWPDGTTLVGLEVPVTVRAGESLFIRAYWAHPSSDAALGGAVRLGAAFARADDDVAGDDPAAAALPAAGVPQAELPAGAWPGGRDAVWVTRGTMPVGPAVRCRSGGRSLTPSRHGDCAVAAQLSRDPPGVRGDARFARSWRLPLVGLVTPASGMAAPVRFEGGVRLVELEPRRVVRPGEWLAVRTAWSADVTPRRRDRAFVQLLDATQALRSSSDREILYGAEPMDGWPAGEVVADRYFVRVPLDMPAGLALVQAGLYDRSTRQRRAVLDASGAKTDDRVLTGIYVDRSHADPSADPTASDANSRLAGRGTATGVPSAGSVAFGDGPRLAGVDMPPASAIAPGRTVTVTLRWQTDRPITRDWTVFVHVIGDATDPRPAAQADGQPFGPYFPTRLWPVGASLASAHALRLPDGPAPAAGWTLAIGLYDATTLERATVDGHWTGGVVDRAERRLRLPLGALEAPAPATTSP